MAKALAFLGTGSDVGKSIVTAGVLRWFANKGVKCAPFKAQNMSNNSWVTLSGGEMGRAQIVQAEAARCEPETDMNPVLLKPSTDTGSQVILNGEVLAHKNARDYFKMSQDIRKEAFKSYDRLASKYDVICLEGAGSCAEMNLKERDFVNFASAAYAKAPVILVADIDRGGVFAQVLGSLMIIPEEERALVKGIIINRFRGDISLFDDGRKYIEEKAGIPVLGVIPYMYDLQIDAEDALPLHSLLDPSKTPDEKKISIAVVYLRSISNHTDINPLARLNDVDLHFFSKPRDLSSYDAVILPGTKNVRRDMAFLDEAGWSEKIKDFKGKVFGICGGYQLLGEKIADPYGVESDPGESEGLKLLPINTSLCEKKYLARVEGISGLFNANVSGYEIHMGKTTSSKSKSLVTINKVNTSQEGSSLVPYDDGAVSEDERIMGTYVHGIFDDESFLKGFLNWVSPQKALKITIESHNEIKERELNRLADHFDKHVDMEKLSDIMFQGI